MFRRVAWKIVDLQPSRREATRLAGATKDVGTPYPLIVIRAP